MPTSTRPTARKAHAPTKAAPKPTPNPALKAASAAAKPAPVKRSARSPAPTIKTKPAAQAAQTAKNAKASSTKSILNAPDAPPLKAEKASKKPAKAGPRLVRDGFTMPEADFALIALLKARALGAQRVAKKSELLRAGLRALAAHDVQALVAGLDALEAVKIGRPKKGR
jgi:hypothetical protein